MTVDEKKLATLKSIDAVTLYTITAEFSSARSMVANIKEWDKGGRVQEEDNSN